MIKIIMGPKGTGKTQKVVDIVNKAIETEKGTVICIERGKRLTYDINYKARLIDISHYPIDGYVALKGFISGLYAGNYDTTHIFIDSLYKVSGCSDAGEAGEFADWCDNFREDNGVQFTIMISAAENEVTDKLRRFF